MIMPEEKAKIFLAGERGLNQLDWFRSYNTFNFGKYFSEHKKAFGDLYVLNDDTLAAGKTVRMRIEETADILLIPVVGTVEFKINNGSPGFVEAGQSLLYNADKNSIIEFANPYENDLINFLQIWIKANTEPKPDIAEIFSFDINETKNSLINLFFKNTNYKIGKYKGREEGVYKLNNPDNGLFVYIIEGAFEVQGRLLQQRDGLALWNVLNVYFEALSNDAIIIFLEVKNKPEA